jgi:LuxR family maltose regulon positive regulatory protein
MESGLIKSKVRLPKVKDKLLERKALFQKLDDVFKFRLTIVTAPAGFGKSTLLFSWLYARRDYCLVSWVSFDETDHDPFSFWKYILYSIDEARKGSVDNAFSMLKPLQANNGYHESCLPVLISELTNLEKDLLLVLDDLHLAATEKIWDDLRFFIKRLPDNVHVILSSRVIPGIGLARLRAERNLLEIDERDLAFSKEEIRCFFKEIMDMNLSEKALDCIGRRTEGWAAGLQMAALYLKGNKCEADLVAHFNGEHRYVFDYLMDEVLGGLENEIQDFLIKTSIVDEMCAGLCNEILNAENSQRTLETLDEQNLFIMPLDETKQWYRYHHLFKDFLKKQQDIPALADTYHRAAGWYERHGFLYQAISLYLKMNMFEQAAKVIEKIDIQILFSDEMRKVYEWSKLLPPALILENLRLCMNVAWFGAVNGDRINMDYYLNQAEKLLDATENNTTKQNDYAEIMIIRAWQANLSNDTAKVKEYLAKTQSYDGKSEVLKALILLLNGVAYIYSGDISKAIYSFDGTLQISKGLQAYSISAMANTNIILSKLLCGQLHECERQCENLLAYYGERHESETPFLGAVYNDLATVYYDWNELSKAMECARKALELGEKGKAAWITARSYSIISRIYFASGNVPKAFESIEKAEFDMVRFKNMDAAGFVDRAKLVMLLKSGKRNEAAKWVAENKFNFEVPNFFYHLIEARLLLSQNLFNEAETLLDKICGECEKCKGYKALSEALLLMSIIDYHNGFSQKAVEKIKKTIHISHEEKYFMVFLSEGKVLEGILFNLKDEIEKNLAKEERFFFHEVLAGIKAASAPVQNTRTVLLSQRETEIIRYIQKGLTNAQISEILYVTTNTIKTHISSIYSKLNVHRRTEALIKAKELNIIR